MADRQKNPGIEETIYDTVVVGGGMAGLTTAYMLRDTNILLLEQEDRFGGRVWTEKVNEATYNVGTQFFTEENSSFVHLVNELGIERVTYDPATIPMSLYLNDKRYTSFYSLFSLRVALDGLKFMSRTYRLTKIFQLPPDDLRYQKLVKQNLVDFQQGYSPELLALVNSYLQGACVSKPERTSAGIGAALMGDIFNTGQLAFVKGGTQQITDTMLGKLGGKIMNGAGVTRVEETEGFVSISFQKNGKEQVIKARSAVMAVPPQIALKLMPQLPAWKKDALSRIKFGPITVISVFLRRDIPWDRFQGMLCNNVIFSGIMDATFDMEADKSRDNPFIYNFIVSIPPDEEKEIEAFLAKSDEEIVALTIKDFKQVMPEADIDNYILDTKVTRFPIGELELSPEYYLELLPQLPKPVGNIHFCGDYCHGRSFLDGAALSAFRVARSLGSKYVVSEKDELAFPKVPKWGTPGWLTIICNLLLIICGFFLPQGYGTTMSIGAGLLLALTAVYPSVFPPFKVVYKVLLGITVGFGGIIGLLTGLIG